MSRTTPAVFTIAPGTSFVRVLAKGLLEQTGGDPLRLARMTVLLPNRRAVRSLAEAFLEASGGRATLLPRLLPLGDLDAEELLLVADEGLLQAGAGLGLAPALPATRRQFLLARLVRHWMAQRGEGLSAGAVTDLAAELAVLLDEVVTAEADLARIEELIPAELAAHWQATSGFLDILRQAWPEIERAEGALGPARRRLELLSLQAEQWRRAPPADPVIAAGSTGSIPAVARLLAVVARLPQGAVVLPGLDREATSDLWETIREDPGHPQHGLALLLETLEVAPGRVVPWPACAAEAASARRRPGSPPPAARVRLIQTALRPAMQTDSWDALAQGAGPADRTTWRQALAGLLWLDCATPRSEAEAVALLLRRTLERPGETAALVTPDRGLARRVAAELGRWGIAVDDSAGRPLAESPPLVFLRHLAEAVAERLAPVPLLALLKHPLAAGGLAPAELRRRVRLLERLVLRGPRPAPDLEGLSAALAVAEAEAEGAERRTLAELSAWLPDLGRRLAPLAEVLGQGPGRLRPLLQAHLRAAEALAASDTEPGAARLWAGEAGEAAAAALAEILGEAEAFPSFDKPDYPQLFETLFNGRVLRPRWGLHPRLFIWGPLEARLQQADLMILGGLNEGTWPAAVEPGPWLNRPMRQALGLPAPERRIGQAAHDVAQALAAPRVVVTRAVKVEGTPTRPSRWLLRLEALTKALDLEGALKRHDAAALGLAEALDRPQVVRPCEPPAPCPPVAARPRRLSVTEVEQWQRNPYGLYARRILRLKALAPLDEDPSAAERGLLVHRVLERFVAAHPMDLPADAAAELERLLAEELQRLATRPGVALIWGPRLTRALAWYLEREVERRPDLASVLVEQRGALELTAPGGTFQLVGLADRLELGRDGSLRIVDYKTGQPPTRTLVEAGIAAQLPLEGAIAKAGGFPGLGEVRLAGLEFWHLTGGRDAGKVIDPLGGKAPLDPEAVAAAAREGLARLVAEFDDPATPYLALPRPQALPRYDDYAHLARVKEWGAVGGEA